MKYNSLGGTSMEQKSDSNLAMACHLLGLVGFLGPLIIWLMKKDESPTVDKHGKESLNFQISIMIYSAGASILIFLLVGFILLPAVMIFDCIMVMVATIKTSKGKDFKYPLTLRLIK
jgi:uncharacterized Tic20 family protein